MSVMMMDQGIIRSYDLHPPGVRVIIDWESMVIGASILVPCIDTESASAQATKIFGAKNWGIRTEIRIENGNLGLRIWRIV